MPNKVGILQPRKAIARAVADYLGGAAGPLKALSVQPGITIDTGRAAGPYPLAAALEDWPEFEKDLKYPTVSCTPVPSTDYAHNFTPTFLENDAHYDPNTDPAVPPAKPGFRWVMQKLSEVEADLVVDVWADSVPQADAVEAALKAAFQNSDDGSYGGLRLRAPFYFNRLVVAGSVRDAPNAGEDQAHRDERRRTMVLACSIENVKLVQLPYFRPQATLTVSEQPIGTPGLPSVPVRIPVQPAQP